MTPSQSPSALAVDLYELTMSAGYWKHGMTGTATFSLFLRNQPHRAYYVSAGLADSLDTLANFRFSDNDLDYLQQLNMFPSEFLSYLQALRFTGDVWAMPEGALFFPDEPILEITAPIIQAQLVETILINTMGIHTLIATKAARCVHAAQGRGLIDFSLRRTHGLDAGMAAARSTYIAGFNATSNVSAGKIYGIPVAGTMAHSFVQSFASETQAFAAYAATFPKHTILLIDTYDTLSGARKAVEIAKHLTSKGHALVGVRLDSGPMVDMSRQVRHILNSAELHAVKIVASGGYDEFGITEAIALDAAVDTFGVGTKLGVSADLPYLDLVYKLVRYDQRDVRKLSPGKITMAGKKQIFRLRTSEGMMEKDIIGHRSESIQGTQPMLALVMKKGCLCNNMSSVHTIRQYFQSQFKGLPGIYKQLSQPPEFPVEVSPPLRDRQSL